MRILLITLTVLICGVSAVAQDAVADNMLMFQRSYGGWPKHFEGKRINYNRTYNDQERASILDDKERNDATIDNYATTKEIRHLLKAYKQHGNKEYLAAAEEGIRYLLKAQYANGGWPQFYPDLSNYRHQITYNDNAMVNVLRLLWDLTHQHKDFVDVNASLQAPARSAIERGVDCILKTQISINGNLTGWCAQHDETNFLPAKARSFELPSLSGMESVGIVQFLMAIEKPSYKVRQAIESAVKWLEDAKVKGFVYRDIDDATQPGGKDRLLIPDASGVVWGRFYDLETLKPFVCGRDGVKKTNLLDVEHERRIGYAWYGTWPKELLEKDYPAWKKRMQVLQPAEGGKLITVDVNGGGDFRSIQEAINSLPDSSVKPNIIFIKNGIYKEKLFITKHNIIFNGESAEGVVITQAIARDEWRCTNPDDWGVATVNLRGNDLTFFNLTIENNYGFVFTEPRTIDCESDTTGKRTIARKSHQMAFRSFESARIKVVNCVLRAYGGDTVSPWNVGEGLFYFKDCIMEGGVDFYCPRGWAYAENCKFISRTGTAAIWHDGSMERDSKTVLNNCRFEGFDGFNLGRYHRDAQFFLVNCSFASNMADQDIFLVPTKNTIKWGRRVYYYNCKKDGGNYNWFANNLHTATEAPNPKQINSLWTFANRWNPEKELKESLPAKNKK